MSLNSQIQREFNKRTSASSISDPLGLLLLHLQNVEVLLEVDDLLLAPARDRVQDREVPKLHDDLPVARPPSNVVRYGVIVTVCEQPT